MHRPFAILEEWVKEGRIRLAHQKKETPEPRPLPSDPASAFKAKLGPQSDSEAFEAAMQDVRRIEGKQGPARRTQPAEIHSNRDEEEALKALEEFCRSGRVEPEHTREYVEHAAHPEGRIYLDDLRSGRFSIQAHLDLHGLNLDQGRPALDRFIQASAKAGHSCVRVVHGRGRHSEGQNPLMKKRVEQWLSHRRLARFVIAYTSARLVDGGGGAVCVLLRRA